MSYNTKQKEIFLVFENNRSIKAFDSMDLALDYKHQYCSGAELKEVILFSKDKEYKSIPVEKKDYMPRAVCDNPNGKCACGAYHSGDPDLIED